MESHVADIHISKRIRLNYLVHLPRQALRGPRDRWPMILFLHGHSESGEDPSLVEQQGLPKTIAQQPEVPLTVYPEAGHDAWTATYANSELYRWFLRHSRV